MGISRVPSKSNLSYMNAHRDHLLFRDLYVRLLDTLWQKQTHLRPELRMLKRKVLLMDATVIPLCLSVFDWARFRSAKGCVLVVDRGYVDYTWMNVLDSKGCFFVTRSKSNMKYTVLKSWQSDELKEAGVIEDQVIALDGVSAARYGDKKMRLVRIWDSIKNVEYEFLTNNFQWKAATVAALYKERWEIETFFKHLKQRLKVTSFVGTSENAVYIQIWTALIGILLFNYIQKRAKYSWNLSNLVNFIRLNIFVKIDLWKWADDPFISGKPPNQNGQFNLF